MKNQKNELATLSPQQQNPYSAVPEDFEVSRADEFSSAYVPGHGQCGASEKEYNQLLKAADAPTVNKSSFGEKRILPTEPGDEK
jgi:hypothetical protein